MCGYYYGTQGQKVRPHSVQTGEVPMGYAHAGHRPRFNLRLRRIASGTANITHSIAA